ncbi:MAG: hypothetical protein A2828_04150 [Candidatus Terrybacteria bacterium RIFCSPHIGHO2_01_FULL_43_35]|uniref:Uncharacterized protein n=1 Tax=Candidatus Terrybacteria bacterium RIFCSPHIGHO2_01_FULL_43_35 TaxID=1802361 RepID=A0A1G2PFK6_9BACT|nr:MAG: hypothetical protein A2828_04150 [Candidatus Terrybacteria bacterium RIFCSPHIGHO2_01_FULL_43_35]
MLNNMLNAFVRGIGVVILGILTVLVYVIWLFVVTMTIVFNVVGFFILGLALLCPGIGLAFLATYVVYGGSIEPRIVATIGVLVSVGSFCLIWLLAQFSKKDVTLKITIPYIGNIGKKK